MTNIPGRVTFGPINSILGTSLGYDSMFKEFDRLINATVPNDKYPPHNIIKLSDYSYVVEFALAGFTKDEIDITVNAGMLTIKGNKKPCELEAVQYLHRGISARSFAKTISIIDTVEVRNAKYEDGILYIFLENIIPEAKKSRKIEISTPEPTKKELLVE